MSILRINSLTGTRGASRTVRATNTVSFTCRDLWTKCAPSSILSFKASPLMATLFSRWWTTFLRPMARKTKGSSFYEKGWNVTLHIYASAFSPTTLLALKECWILGGLNVRVQSFGASLTGF